MASSIKRVLLPIGPAADRSHLLRTATVFSKWFEAPLQLVCSEQEGVADLQVLAAGLGVPIEPVLSLHDPFGDGLTAHAHSTAPSIIVADLATTGPAVAAASTQPVFLTADTTRPRMAVGPLVLEMTGDPRDLDAVALSAVLASAIGESIRLIVDDTHGNDTHETALAHVADAKARLREMGCEVGTDVLRPGDAQKAGDKAPLVVVGRTRGATAIVIPAHRIDEPGLLAAAAEEGVGVFVAPGHDPEIGRAAPFAVDLSTALDHPPPGAKLGTLDREECLARLDRHTVARIAYVDEGWPMVVPVNYRLHRGDIVVRSLAGAKLRAAERGDMVCFELDGYDEALRTGWSVVAHGRLEVIGDPSVLRDAWASDPQPWVASERWQWLRMIPMSVSGREVWPSAPG